MATIPHDKSLDSTLALMRQGYTFLHKRCQRYRSDLFQTRLGGLKVICLHGDEAAQVFYDPERFQRQGAVPKLIQKSFLGERPIHSLDGAAHRHHKEMFLSLLMTPANLDRLRELSGEHWQVFITRWEGKEKVALFTEAQELLCRVACAWAGVPLKESEARQRARDFWDMVDAFGAFTPPRHVRGMLARRRAEWWLAGIIEEAQSGKMTVGEGTAVSVIALHRGLDGQPLDTKGAVVALINVLRPIVAISTYVTFAALALHEHPQCRHRLQQALQAGEEDYLDWFVQEVRRFYPFAPFMAAHVKKAFDWRGCRFEKGQLVLLDIYGTNHDARLWERPDEFEPERFRHGHAGKFDLIPQGGGDYLSGHRCPGEGVTIEATKVAVRALTQQMTYEVPDQEMTFSLARMPTVPRSGFVMTQVTRAGRMNE